MISRIWRRTCSGAIASSFPICAAGVSRRATRKSQNYQPAIYVQDILALLDMVDAPRVAVIGTSLGGMLAMMLGFSQPARIAGMVLNDVGPEIDPVGVERIKQYAGRLPPARTWSVAMAQTRAMYGDAWPGLAAGSLGSACAARLSRGRGRHRRARRRSQYRRSAARRTRGRARPMAAVEGAAQCPDAGDSRRPLGHLERRHLSRA